MKNVFLAIGAIVLAVIGFAVGNYQGGQKQKSIKIAYAGFSHETCTFCPSPPTGIEQFEHMIPPLKGVALQAVPKDGIGYIAGFLHAAKAFPDVQTVGAYAVGPAFGGSSGSWITTEAFDKYTNGIAEELKKIDDLDGVYLFLHGGMAVTGVPRPEAEIVRRVKEAVGDIPVAATFDHHGNEDEKLLEHLDIALAVKRFPHYDANLMGERAARVLVRTIRGDYKPTMAAAKPGVFYATVFGGTHDGAPQDIMERARRWENRHLDAYVSVFQGWTFADVPDIGMAVMALTNDDQALADEIVEDMVDYIRSRKEDFEYRIPGVEEGVAQGLAALEAGEGPVVFANMSDRMGDSTLITHELLKRGARKFAIGAIADIDVLNMLIDEHKAGDTVRVDIGGKSSELAGPPLTVEGTLRLAKQMSPLPMVSGPKYAVIETTDGNWIALSEYYYQVMDPQELADLGIPIDDLDIFVVKSRNHFRRGFMETGFAKTAVVIDAPGHGPADISRLDYKNIPDGIYSKFRAGAAAGGAQ